VFADSFMDMEPSGIMDWPAKGPCGRPLRLRRLRGGRLSGVIEATKAQTLVLLTFELPEADGRGGEISLETPGRMP
jgi:hypothetical protein